MKRIMDKITYKEVLAMTEDEFEKFISSISQEELVKIMSETPKIESSAIKKNVGTYDEKGKLLIDPNEIEDAYTD